MVKRKRKAPKRRKRRNRFGNQMVDELKKELMSPIAEELEKIKDDDLVKKIPSGTSPKVIETSKIIKKSLIDDFKGSDQTLTKTKATIKQAEEDGANAFYKMIDASGINTKMGEIFEKAKAKALKSIPGGAVMGKLFSLDKLGKAITLVYDKTKDPPKKLIFHVISKIVKKDFPENAKDLLEQAGGVAKQAGDKIKNQVTGGTTTGFGKRKRGPSASLKRMCKKHGVRLMVKRGKTRVYKSSKVLKGECQRKLKRKLKKNFGRKKIKRSGIMPPKRKTRGKKRSRLSSAARGAKRRVSAAARYARRNPGTAALGGLAGLGTLGLGAYEGYAKYKRSQGDGSYYSPTGEAFKRVKGGAADVYVYFKDTPIETIKEHIMALPEKTKAKVISAAEAAKKGTMGFPGRIRGFFSGKKEDNMQTFLQGPIDENKQSKTRELDAMYNRSHGTFRGLQPLLYGKRRRRKRRKFGDNCSTHKKPAYGKRRKRKSSFGKKVKKPSAATRRMCKKLKVRMTLKRGKKRVYKSEAMLKKQCKKAMKRKSKK